ncbi:MAG TPA: hypothetical protein VHA82_12405 [Ramlibacter sp.]|uniref:hypothetical protein n=1 Tax=Ramlibacter sp. TaxID=1917967 RepID=UPI002C0ACBB8|nr:hypothetical protein [Ramlibacter sp.]HVZ44603.1 hypothetical protein [Ramlibacter sp.]
MSYKQAVKSESRSELWRHAVETLTAQRDTTRILAPSYMEAVWQYAWGDVLSQVMDIEPHRDHIRAYFDYWAEFSESSYGAKGPDELRVAYFAGPEPENDLHELLRLGVRIENVWAFESDQTTYKEALRRAREGFPVLKIFPGSLADFFKTTHVAFDIVYLDFTGSLVARSLATLGTLHAVFDEQALSDLAVLVVNSCEPDVSDEVCEFLAAYYYFQPMVECTAYGEQPREEDGKIVSWFSEPASSHGYEFDDLKRIAASNLTDVYSAFATSYPLYYSSFVSPTLRFLRNGALRRQLFTADKSALVEAFDRMSDTSVIRELLGLDAGESKGIRGDRLLNVHGFPFWNFVDTLRTKGGDLGKYWFSEYSRGVGGVSVLDAARFRESLPETLAGYDGLLAANIKNEIRRVNAAIPDARHALFCDLPMPHLWLELALNQLGAPYHANVENQRRWTYTAKVRRMHLDAFTFDRCRSLYDFLPMVDMYGDVLKNQLPQMIARCCIDAIGKQGRWPLSNLYYGSNVACIGDCEGAQFAELQARVKLGAR